GAEVVPGLDGTRRADEGEGDEDRDAGEASDEETAHPRATLNDQEGRRQMSRTPLVRWSFALPTGSVIRPSVTIGLFQWPLPASRDTSRLPLVGTYTSRLPPGS